MDERLPQYLHKPVQILWFGSDEFVLVITVIFVAVIVGGMLGWALVAGLLLFVPWLRTKPRGFIPQQDMGYLLIAVQLPDSASLERTDRVMHQIEQIGLEIPGVKHVAAIGGLSFAINAQGSNFGTLFVGLKDYSLRRTPETSSDVIKVNVVGSGGVQVSKASGVDGLAISVEGSGNVDLGMVDVSGTTRIDLMGSGNVQVGGRTDRIEIMLQGSGDVNATSLRAKNGGKVHLAGSGNAYVHSDGQLEMVRKGTGTIHTSGSAGVH